MHTQNLYVRILFIYHHFIVYFVLQAKKKNFKEFIIVKSSREREREKKRK